MTPRSQSNRLSHLSATALPREDGADQLEPAIQSGSNVGFNNIVEADWRDTPNPFARVLAASEPSAKSRFARAAKTLLVTLGLTAVLMAGFSYGRQFLLAQLVSGFDELGPASQQHRLTQIAGFGPDAIEPLVEKLAAKQETVSASAFTLLQQMQNDWITLPPESAMAAHDRLIRAVASTFYPVQGSDQADSPGPVQRTRASELLRQSVLEFSSSPAQASGLLRSASELLAQLDGHVSSSPTLVGSSMIVGSNANVHKVAKVVPISSSIHQSGWTDWPPPASTQPAKIVRAGTQHAKLQALPHGVTAPLRPIMASPATTADSPAVTDHRPANHVMQVAAHEELVDHGAANQQLELATKLKSAGPIERLQMVDSLASSGQLESEPWLSILLHDPDRRVRLQVAAALEKTRNLTVMAELRKHVVSEKDPHVAARIRRILDLF